MVASRPAKGHFVCAIQCEPSGNGGAEQVRMSKIVAYKCVSTTSEIAFITDVNQLLSEGWELWGSVAVSAYVNSQGESWSILAQALVQYKDVDRELK